MPLISNSAQPTVFTWIHPSHGAAAKAMTITNALEQNSIDKELSVVDIRRVTMSLTALENAAAMAINEAMPIVVGSGRTMTNTPTKPMVMVSQRLMLTRSPRSSGASAATKSGLEKTMETICASGSSDKPMVIRSVVNKNKTARRSWGATRVGNKAR